jgi:hypothetical protein
MSIYKASLKGSILKLILPLELVLFREAVIQVFRTRRDAFWQWWSFGSRVDGSEVFVT